MPRSLFPIAYESHGHLFVELIRDHGGPAPIWYYAFGDPTIECRYPSLASIFRACAEVVELAGVVAPARDEDRHATYGDLLSSQQLTAVVDRHFAMSPHARRTEVPSHDSSGWPAAWRLAEGIDDDYMAVRGRTHTVAQFVAAAQHGPVEARLHGRWATLGGMGEVGFGELTDDTGTVALVVPLAVPDVGGSDGRVDVEVDVTATAPATDRLDLDSSSVLGAIAAGDYDAASQIAGAAGEALQGAAGDLPRISRMVPLA